jgi:tetratricopeptide (TPR) repeat protein
MEPTGDAISQIRRMLRERAEQEAARSLDREQRAATRWARVRHLLGAIASYITRFVVPVQAARVRHLGGAITRALSRVVRSSARRAYTLGVASATSIWLAARRSTASAGNAISIYRARRTAIRIAREHLAAAVTDPPPALAADPTTEREPTAEALERRQLSLREDALGPDHPDVAMLTYIIATRCAARGDYDEAQALYERTLRIFEQSLGADHPEVAEVLTDLAELHTATGRTDEAARCLARAADITAGRRRMRDMAAIEPTVEMAHPG